VVIPIVTGMNDMHIMARCLCAKCDYAKCTYDITQSELALHAQIQSGHGRGSAPVSFEEYRKLKESQRQDHFVPKRRRRQVECLTDNVRVSYFT